MYKPEENVNVTSHELDNNEYEGVNLYEIFL